MMFCALSSYIHTQYFTLWFHKPLSHRHLRGLYTNKTGGWLCVPTNKVSAVKSDYIFLKLAWPTNTTKQRDPLLFLSPLFAVRITFFNSTGSQGWNSITFAQYHVTAKQVSEALNGCCQPQKIASIISILRLLSKPLPFSLTCTFHLFLPDSLYRFSYHIPHYWGYKRRLFTAA